VFKYFGQCRQKTNRSVRVSFGWKFSGLGYRNNLGVLPLYRKVAWSQHAVVNSCQ
jgi:hypothetical protein